MSNRMKKVKEKAPIDATWNQLAKMRRDNVDTPDFWCMVDGCGEITIAQQKSGEPATAMITMPRSVMKRFIKFLVTPQGLKG